MQIDTNQRNEDWRESLSQYLATATFVLAGYGLGTIAATIGKAFL